MDIQVTVNYYVTRHGGHDVKSCRLLYPFIIDLKTLDFDFHTYLTVMSQRFKNKSSNEYIKGNYWKDIRLNNFIVLTMNLDNVNI